MHLHKIYNVPFTQPKPDYFAFSHNVYTMLICPTFWPLRRHRLNTLGCCFTQLYNSGLWFPCIRNKSPTLHLSGMEHVLVKDTQSQEWKRSLWLEGCQSFRSLGTGWMKGWETSWEWQHRRVCLCFAFCNNIIINCLISQKAIHPNTIPRDQTWPNNEWLL